MGLLKRIVEMNAEMGAAEQRIADYVSTNPDKVIHMSMSALSAACDVSDPTIMRFCRRLGYEGYQSFKLNLAQTLVPAAPFEYEQIAPHDSVAAIVRKTCRNSMSAIQRAEDEFVPAEVAAAAETLVAAGWIGIYASGISEIVALDAEHKFQRLGLRCAAVVGRKKQTMLSRQAGPSEVALIFSQSGATRQMVDVAIASRRAGATVLSVTAADSPLAKATDRLVAVRAYERTELMTPLASRLNHHLVVNMLVTVIAVAKGAAFPDQLPALDPWQTEKL